MGKVTKSGMEVDAWREEVPLPPSAQRLLEGFAFVLALTVGKEPRLKNKTPWFLCCGLELQE